MIAPCLHCQNETAPICCRGLCAACYYNLGVRERYPRRYVAYKGPQPEPTEEELNAIIAEQTQRLPDWWPAPKPEEPPPVEIVVIRDPGRILRKRLP